MYFTLKMESVIISITAVLCTILLYKLLLSLRKILPWRVNCWFCNNNFWVKYPDRNSWTCPKCEQYNGFTKDGDYNKPLFASQDQLLKSSSMFQCRTKNPPQNGLCKMCNINQQLKVTQLANFVPMNENNFEDEIESYRMQLEKAYKLCFTCRKVVQKKLHKEKENLLGSKLLENRSPEKKKQIQGKQRKILTELINATSIIIAGFLLLLVCFECYQNINSNAKLSDIVQNVKSILKGLYQTLVKFVKKKTALAFPFLDNYLIEENFVDILPRHYINKLKQLEQNNLLTQTALGGLACFIQIIGHLRNINKLTYTIVIDLLWTVFVSMSIGHSYVAIDPVIISFIKAICLLALIIVYRNITRNVAVASTQPSPKPKKMKNMSNGSINPFLDEDDDSVAMDTDDDVSLTKFGLHNFTDSSNETMHPVNNSLMNGRSFTPRNDGMWTKPKLNSTFCVNTVLSKSPSSVSDTVQSFNFVKPSFYKYQKLANNDSDSDLDESISSLCIGSAKKVRQKKDSIFSLRKFTATPNFVMPTARPVISPSKLGTSWVAGGYWGSEGERQIFNVNGSRSSSQSSGFESQASSLTQRNLCSAPASRAGSVCGDDAMPPAPPAAASPVFPQMQYNSHVHIPQPIFPKHPGYQNVFAQQHYVQTNVFKAPRGSSLIKLPQASSMSR